jgi:hypothetical protein
MAAPLTPTSHFKQAEAANHMSWNHVVSQYFLITKK